MKKILLYFFVLSLTFLIGIGLNSIHPSTIAKNEVLSLMNEFHNAIADKNHEKLKLMVADKMFVSGSRDESIISSKEFTENIISIESPIESIDSFLISTSVENKSVKVYFYTVITFVDEDGKTFNHQGFYTYTFGKKQSDWKLASIKREY